MIQSSLGAVQISRVLHAGYVLEHEQTAIVFDPLFESPFSQNCYSYPAIEFNLTHIQKLKWDAVFISHYHDDHFSIESLQHIDRETPIYMFCIFDEMFLLLKQLGFTNVKSLKLGETIKINSFEVICHPALDIDVDCIFQIQVAGLNILNVVDSWIDEETFKILEKQKPWDLVLWPFQLMREIETLVPSRATPWDGEWPIEWKNQLEKLQPRVLVPSSCQFVFESWSWLNSTYFPVTYQSFEKEMKSLLPKASVLRLDPGQSIYLNLESFQTAEPLKWIKKLSDHVVDYQYDPFTKIPPTKEIAKHFPQLKSEQSNRVFDFCQQGILKKYQSLEVSIEPYFEKTVYWKLCVYNHLGDIFSFFYKIQGSQIERVDSNDFSQFGWLTEIPVSKLYTALFHGESLTSLYLRINDCTFDAQIENEMVDIDIMNDPLLRCLYDGAIASYQKEQLIRL